MRSTCYHCQDLLLAKESWYGLHKSCFEILFGIDHAREFSDLAPRSQSQAPHEGHRSTNASFFHGAYRKYSARLGPTTYIFKVQQKEYPELPATEFLCNQIYDSLGVLIPPYYLIKYPDDQPCFVTKNFMSELVSSDLVHIYHFIKNDLGHDCESLVKIIGDQTGRRTDQERFVHLTLADALTGNHDRHGRNLGFIRNAKGVSLAPFYDNPSAIGIEDHSMLGADLQPRGSIYTKATKEPTLRDYVIEWNRLGYGNVVSQFKQQYSEVRINKLIEKSPLSERRKSALLRLIAGRGQEL